MVIVDPSHNLWIKCDKYPTNKQSLTVDYSVYLRVYLLLLLLLYTMSTPVAGPSHHPHPSPLPGQPGQTPTYDQSQKRRQESDDTRRTYALVQVSIGVMTDGIGNMPDHPFPHLISYRLSYQTRRLLQI